MHGAGRVAGLVRGAGRGAGRATRLATLLVALLAAAVAPAGARVASEGRPYTVYVGAWTSCVPLSGEPAASADRQPDMLGASSRHVGHLRDFRHLDADRTLLPARSLVYTARLGYQRREVGCRDAAGRSTEIMNCKPLLEDVPTMQTCVMRSDCVLGDWSPWRPRPGGGYRRTRSVLELAQGGGRDCGLVEEVRPLVPEPGAHWAAGAWGACHVAGVTPPPPPPAADAARDDTPESDAIADVRTVEAGPCGGGAQRRDVTCVRADGRALHPAHCADLPSPQLQQPCEVACPRDCAVGEWGPWSACRPLGGCPLYPVQELTTAGYSARRRRVVTAASAGGAACPALQETRACVAPRCASWHARPWSACTLTSPPSRNTVAAAGERAACGAGTRTRELRCLDHEQNEAPRSWCSRGDGSAAWTRSERCRIACAGDCVLSAWGAWGACTAPCSAPGHASPTRTRRRHVLAHAAPDGWPCPPESELVQSETCNTHACSSHSWLALPWGACRPLSHAASAADDINDYVGTKTLKDGGECLIAGEMTRNVSCVENNDRIVKDALCMPLVKPVVRRACSLPCPRACDAGTWSEWSECPNTCEPATQSRERAVWGGDGCGARQERRACPAPRSCAAAAVGHVSAGHVAWSAGTWGRCRLPPSLACGWGHRTRGVWCSAGAHRVDASACAHGTLGLRSPPAAVQRCHVPCTDAAIRTAATAATALWRYHCHQLCIYGFSHVDKFEPTKADCNCPKFYLKTVGSPSDCILPPGSSCGTGRILQAALCVMEDANNTLLDVDICKRHIDISGAGSVRTAAGAPAPGYTYDEEFPELLQRACAEPCPRDCAAGPWSEWGPCVREQDSLAAFRIRTRAVVYGAEHGGRECGPTLQRAACARREAAWRAGDWEACTPAEPPCGGAEHNRTVRCVLVDGEAEVAESECAGAAAPPRRAACDAPCPADCVVSQWSDWSPCEQYKSGGRRDRTRVVLRAPAPGGASCPHLVQAEPCAARAHAWHVAPWDDCQPLGGSPCGEGTKRRIVRCLRDDGVFVNDSFCPNMTAAETRVSWCYVPCGADCEQSEWSAWDSAACSCGVSEPYLAQRMTRTRRRVSGAAWPGRACGPDTQQAPCPRNPCVRYSQQPPTTDCLIEPLGEAPRSLRAAHACGHGVRLVRTSCEQYAPGAGNTRDASSGALLDLSRCGGELPGQLYSAPLPYQTQHCKVECACSVEPSPTGAELGEWSAWGPCLGGVRSRARRRLARARPHCLEPKFVTIEWANCTAAGVAGADAGADVGASGVGAAEYEDWFDVSPPDRSQHVNDDLVEHTAWVAVAMVGAALVTMMLAMYPYRQYKKGKQIDDV